MKKVNSILKEVLKRIEPPEEDLKLIDDSVKKIFNGLNKRIKKLKINAETFVGGSFAKKTVIKKDEYDVDIFIRFDKKYRRQDISKLTGRIIKGMKNISVIHGSRDYFRIKFAKDFFIEIVPVLKINKPEEAENITDLSYSHVNYIKKKIKSEKILDEIRIAKAFCFANKCYGAESYINGFSGYGLELLIYYYGSFLKFLKELIKVKERKIIDIERHFKRKKNILLDLNAAKLTSPIILIDPTYKQRNALAALSQKTFERFQKAAKKFLKKPSIKDFELKKTDLEKIEKSAKKKNQEFVLAEIHTNKQPGDVAGSKLLKFYNYFAKEIGKLFDINKKGFNYNGVQAARFYIVAKSKKELIITGPNVKDEKSVKNFKKKHKNTFVKSKRIHAREKIKFNLKKFIDFWKNKNKKRLKEMYITKLNIL